VDAGKLIHSIITKNDLINKSPINQLPTGDIAFGTMLAAVLVYRVEPANYISCG
jgi:hypothetical protein